MKITIDIQHRYTDNDNEENEYIVKISDDTKLETSEYKCDDIQKVKNFISLTVRETLFDLGMY